MRKYYCSECSYVYDPILGEEELSIAPGTDFSDISDFHCPSCLASEEAFVSPNEEIQTVLNPRDLHDIEESHVPIFHFEDDGLVVTLGNEENPHPIEDDHKIEWLAVFDSDEDMIELIKQPDLGEYRFEGYEAGDTIYVRSSCNVHGIWEGIQR